MVVGRKQRRVERHPVEFVRLLLLADDFALFEPQQRIPYLHGTGIGHAGLGVAVQPAEHVRPFLVAIREVHAGHGVVFGGADQRIREGQGPGVLPVPDGIENVQGLRRMTPATPTNATFNGDYITGSNGSNPSLSCYYWLNEKQQLSVHLNKTKRVLDENVVFVENLVEYGVNDAREFVFYLKEGTADDGSDCYRLMGATRQGRKEFTVRDYDVCLYAQRFQTAHVNDGSRYGIHYLYWTESIAPDPDNADQEERYRIKCVRFDRETNTMSAPFTLVELSHYPASIHLLPDGTGYYTTDLEQAQTLNESAVNSRRLIRFEFELKIAAELTGVASSDPCVTAGESAGLLFSVENKGNLPISRFGVTIKQGSKIVQQVLVDCQNPQNSVNSLFASNGPGYSVTRLENVYDDMNGDRWLVTTTGDNGQMVEEALHTDLLMPGGVHTYEAAIEIPDDWDGTISLTAELENVYAMTQYASLIQGSVAVQANGADMAQYEVCALPSGEVTGPKTPRRRSVWARAT